MKTQVTYKFSKTKSKIYIKTWLKNHSFDKNYIIFISPNSFTKTWLLASLNCQSYYVDRLDSIQYLTLSGFYVFSVTVHSFWYCFKVLSISPSVNSFALGDFQVHHEDCFTYFGWSYRAQKTLPKFLTFQLGSLTAILTIFLCWIFSVF